MTTVEHGVTVRPAEVGDRASVLCLLQASLGWDMDERHAKYFAWKHEQSPFGPSPAWVALDRDGTLLGFRTFLCWEFLHGATVVRAVRAVDTATRPDAQRQGIFSRLTTTAIQSLVDDGVSFVFNTPNAQSIPGYLRMGWQRVSRLPVRARTSSLARWARVARARVPAEKWSLPTDAGVPAREAFADREVVGRLLSALQPTTGLHTRLGVDYLRWRYGYPDLQYRVLTAGRSVEDGMLVFRLRRRGRAIEAVVCDVLVPSHEARLARHLCRRVVAGTGADYALRVGRSSAGSGFVSLPGQGPVLTWRALMDPKMPSAREWDLSLGDVELF